MVKCIACGSDDMEIGYLTGEMELLYVMTGKPTIMNTMLGKKKAVKVYICRDCGFCMMYSK